MMVEISTGRLGMLSLRTSAVESWSSRVENCRWQQICGVGGGSTNLIEEEATKIATTYKGLTFSKGVSWAFYFRQNVWLHIFFVWPRLSQYRRSCRYFLWGGSFEKGSNKIWEVEGEDRPSRLNSFGALESATSKFFLAQIFHVDQKPSFSLSKCCMWQLPL